MLEGMGYRALRDRANAQLTGDSFTTVLFASKGWTTCTVIDALGERGVL